MLRIQFALLLAGLGVVFAATTLNSTIDPASVTITVRSQWCFRQAQTCGILCSGEVGLNTCAPDTLTFACTCASNNSSPDLYSYKETMPTFICEQIFANCIVASVGDAAGQAQCSRNEKANCGQLDPLAFVAPKTTTTTSRSVSPATTSSSTTTLGSSTSSKTSSSNVSQQTSATGSSSSSSSSAVSAAASTSTSGSSSSTVSTPSSTSTSGSSSSTTGTSATATNAPATQKSKGNKSFSLNVKVGMSISAAFLVIAL